MYTSNKEDFYIFYHSYYSSIYNSIIFFFAYKLNLVVFYSPRLSSFIHYHYHYFRLSPCFGALDEQIIFQSSSHWDLINPFITFIQSHYNYNLLDTLSRYTPFFLLRLTNEIIFNRYNVLLRRPLITNMIKLRDYQLVVAMHSPILLPNNDNNNLEQQPFDYLRNLRFHHIWIINISVLQATNGINSKHQSCMDKKCSKPQYQINVALLRVMADQLVLAPFIGIPLYYSSMTNLENRQPFLDNIIDKFNTSWWIT